MKRTRMLAEFLVTALGVGGCDATARSSSTPLTSPPTPIPVVSAILPNRGSTDGGAPTTITGTNLQSVSTVTFGGVSVSARRDLRDRVGTILYLETPPHLAGIVEVVVYSSGGLELTLPGAYTYALPESFDFNGIWSGFGNAGQDIPISFTIQNGRVQSVSCDTYATLSFTPPLQVTDGAFFYTGAEGVSLTGRIVSTTHAVGTINLYPCTNTAWGAGRVQASGSAGTTP